MLRIKHSLSEIFRKISPFPYWTGYLALFLAAFGSYGLFASRLGFYWDEWPFLWFDHAYGPAGVIKYFNTLRPFLGYFYAATIPVLGTNALAWQIFGILTRILAGFCLLRMLLAIWPTRQNGLLAIAILFMVYPSFGQQFIAIMWSHLFLLMAVFFCSITWMIRSVRQPNHRMLYLVLSLAASAVSLFTSEYFFGLELLRPILLWIVFATTLSQIRDRVKQVALVWLPYIILVCIYLYWRVAVYQFPTYQPEMLDLLRSNPLSAVWQMLVKVLHDLRVLTFDSLLRLFTGSDAISSLIMYWLVMIGVIAVWSVFFRLLKSDQSMVNNWKTWPLPLILLGVISLVLGGTPFLVTSLPIEIRFPNDRFTLPLMVGACMLLVGLIEMIPGRIWLKAGFLGALVGLACGVQYQNGLKFVQDHQIQNEFLWQLQWRAPSIQPGTLLISEKLPHFFESDNSLTAALHWTYAPEFSGPEMPYLLSYGSVRLRTGKLKLEPNTPIEQDYRVAVFRGNSSQAMVVYNKLPGCVRILDPERDKWLPNLPNTILKALALSRLDLVIANPEQPAFPPAFIGNEPQHGWCYYFEKAELARSLSDWHQVVTLAEKARQQSLSPAVPSEWTVFIEGYALTGDWQQAMDLTRTAFQADPELDRPLCTTWGLIERQVGSDPALEEPRREMFALMGCK